MQRPAFKQGSRQTAEDTKMRKLSVYKYKDELNFNKYYGAGDLETFRLQI